MKNHKACRILALVLENSSILSRIIFRYFALVFQDSLTALRSISVISLSVSQHLTLSTLQEQQIIESSFDWLISETKSGHKTYSIRTLFELGKNMIGYVLHYKVFLELPQAFRCLQSHRKTNFEENKIAFPNSIIIKYLC
jgi:hypothetical protein